MKTRILYFILMLPFFSIAQNLNLRKAILKSDLIISINNYKIDTVWVNDFTYKVFVNMDDINEQNS